MVGVTDIIQVLREYEQNLLQLTIKPHHILVGFSVTAGAEFPIPGCTLMVEVHVVQPLQVIVNLHYDG
jgi:hypothetical protein